jgi:hypothetical protein
MRMKLGRAAVVTAMTAVVGLGMTQAAQATVMYTSYEGVQGQVDDDPGNGAASWVWAHANSDAVGGVQYEFYDGNIASLNVAYGSSVVKNTAADVWRFRVYSTNSSGNTSYSAWKNLS